MKLPRPSSANIHTTLITRQMLKEHSLKMKLIFSWKIASNTGTKINVEQSEVRIGNRQVGNSIYSCVGRKYITVIST
jgi:hypothetical protein